MKENIKNLENVNSIKEISGVDSVDIFDNKFKKYIILSMVYLSISILFLYEFLYLFYSNVNFSVFMFIVIVIIFFIFIIYFMKAISIYTENRSLILGKKASKIKTEIPDKKKSFMNNFLYLMEEFPYEDRYTGNKRTIIKYMGWAVLLWLFFTSITIRVYIEFLTGSIPLIFLIHDFGFYGFAFMGGTVIMYYFSGKDLSKVIKAGLIGFSIIIQIPTAVDYYIYGTSMSMRLNYYGFVQWEDLIKAFTTCLMDSKIQSYACKLGHPVMFILLMGLVGMYVFTNNNKIENGVRNDIYISFIKTFLAVVSVYIFLQITGVFEPMLEVMLNQIYSFLYLTGIYSTSPHPNYILLSIYFYFFMVFLLIWMKIHIEEMEKNRKRKSVKIKSMGDFEYLDDYLKWLNEVEEKYKSKYALKLNILLMGILGFTIFLILMVPPS
ncbi:MAG: hypothetical protein ACTSPY_10345 [Candidatus Helarchaeota archaeon]